MSHLLLPHNIRLKPLHNFPDQGSSNAHATNAPQIHSTVQFQTTTPTRQPIL